MKLNNIFSDITIKLDELDQLREQILKISRQMIRKCSVAIKSIHRQEFEAYEKKISEIKDNHEELLKLVNDNPMAFSYHLKTPEQEYVEAVGLYKIVKGEEIPTPKELGVDDVNYLLGLADVIGELRRLILDKITRDELENIEKILEQMENIHSHLFALDYPKGITKDLRRKTDVGRSIIEKTRGDITLSIQINRLNKNLKNK